MAYQKDPDWLVRRRREQEEAQIYLEESKKFDAKKRKFSQILWAANTVIAAVYVFVSQTIWSSIVVPVWLLGVFFLDELVKDRMDKHHYRVTILQQRLKNASLSKEERAETSSQLKVALEESERRRLKERNRELKSEENLNAIRRAVLPMRARQAGTVFDRIFSALLVSHDRKKRAKNQAVNVARLSFEAGDAAQGELQDHDQVTLQANISETNDGERSSKSEILPKRQKQVLTATPINDFKRAESTKSARTVLEQRFLRLLAGHLQKERARGQALKVAPLSAGAGVEGQAQAAPQPNTSRPDVDEKLKKKEILLKWQQQVLTEGLINEAKRAEAAELARRDLEQRFSRLLAGHLQKERARGQAEKLARKSQAEKWREIDLKYEARARLRSRLESLLGGYAHISNVLSITETPEMLARQLWLETRTKPGSHPYGVSDSGAEMLAAEWLRYLGQHNVVVTQYSNDGGVDVLTDTYACQVKNYKKAPVGASEVRDLLGTAVALSRKPVLFTSSSLSSSAQNFCATNEIAAICYSPEGGSLSPLNDAGRDLLDFGAYGEE